MFVSIYDLEDISFAEPTSDFSDIIVNQYIDILKHNVNKKNCITSIYGKCKEPLINFFTMKNIDFRIYGKMTYVIHNRPYRIVCANHDGTITTYRMSTLANVKDTIYTKINSDVVDVDYIFIDDLRYGTNTLGTVTFDITKLIDTNSIHLCPYHYNTNLNVCEYGDNEPSIMRTSSINYFVDSLFEMMNDYRISSKQNKRIVVCNNGRPVAIGNPEAITSV